MTALKAAATLEERAERDLRIVDERSNQGRSWQPPEKRRSDPTHVEIVGANTIESKPIRWLWPGWLAKGKLHILAGAPGTGKTTIAMSIAACVSAGLPLPSGWRPTPGRVLIWSGEDDPGDTLVPRLRAAGANLKNVSFVGDTMANGERVPFDPARDVPLLAAAIAECDDLSLIVVDPLVSAVSGDSHKNAETRRSLAPLVDMALRHNAALVGITHYSKGTQGREPLERVSGSLAFGALARVVYGTVRQNAEDDEQSRYLLARLKSNIGPDGGGFAYAFEQTTLPDGIEASRIVFGEAVEGAARDLIGDAEDACEERDSGAGAVNFLVDLLAGGPVKVKDVRRHADDAGFAWRTVQRAMKKAGVASQRAGFGLPATWSLDRTRATVAPVTPHNLCGANGATGAEVAQHAGHGRAEPEWIGDDEDETILARFREAKP